MVKLSRLIANEWKKEFSKVATWVMLAVLAVATLLSVFSAFLNPFGAWILYEDSFEAHCEQEIAWFEEMLLAGKDDAESMVYYRIQIEAYRIMLEAEMDWEDWRYVQNLATVAAEAKYGDDPDTYQEVLSVIRSNSTDAYYAWKKASYSRQWAQDTERIAIYSEIADFCIAEDVIPYAAADWRYAQVLSLVEARETVLVQERLRQSGGAWSADALQKAKDSAAVAGYRLENGMEVNPADSFAAQDWTTYLYGENATTASRSAYWDAVAGSVDILGFAGVVVIILAGGIVANEFSAGTVKLLLFSPVRRWRILLAKYLAVLLFGGGVCVSVWLLSVLAALPLGVGDVLLPAVFARNGEVYTVSPYLLLIGDYGLSLVRLTVVSTMAIALSALTRSASSAIALTVIFDLSGTMVAYLFYGFGIDWGRYLLFSNLDLAAILEGNAIFPHQSLAEAILCIVLHMAVFLLTAHDAFVRREV